MIRAVTWIDLADSKRVNASVQSALPGDAKPFPFQATVVSSNFWPTFRDEPFREHPLVGRYGRLAVTSRGDCCFLISSARGE
jgi:hypothetical protein